MYRSISFGEGGLFFRKSLMALSQSLLGSISLIKKSLSVSHE